MMRKNTVLAILLIAIACFIGSRTASARTLPADSYQQSLESLQNKVPLSYNESVRKTIEAYTSQKKRFGEMLGLSKYYFPIYEKVFRERGIPEEIKYLSVIESSLNANAVSRVGATGAWQFMYEVGKIYGLAINDSIDERKDPVLAANAAASYLLDSYNIYGDWLLAIASYNCGKNRIKWAIEDSGGQKDYWAIRKYLPAETQNYIPAYIATVYIMNNYQKHDIFPEAGYLTETETLPVKSVISFEDISRQTGLNLNQLTYLNPSYKKQIVNATETSPRNIVIPVLPTYTYNSLCKMLGLPGRYIPEAKIPDVPVVPATVYYLVYYVQEGDTITSIAGKFTGATEDQIKTANNLSTSVLKPGMMLKIRQG
jgi:membrane-bound lytic murein transglycosylase D